MAVLIDELMRQAFALHQAGDLTPAEELYRQILYAEPHNIDATYLLGEIASLTGRNQVATDLIRKAISLNDSVAIFHHTLGYVLQAQGKLDEAASSYRDALKLDASNAETHYNLGGICKARGVLDKAEACFREVLRIKPDSVEALGELAEVFLLQRKYNQLPSTYREIVRLKLVARTNPPSSGIQPHPRVRLTDTTLCCVDCVYHDLAVHAIRRCMEQCAFDRVVFLTDKHIDLPDVEVVIINKISSLLDYSKFMVKHLSDYIDTDFALVMQYDGYILDAQQWTERFKQYDYIGAKWDVKTGYKVGNGGFSLRSKRLLEALQDPRIVHVHPEDYVICLVYRRFLEQEYRIKFAPEEVADQFAFDSVPRVASTFGFHGIGHLTQLVGLDEGQLAHYNGANAQTIILD